MPSDDPSPEAPRREEPPTEPASGLTPDQAMQLLTVETNKRRRVASATHSGSRLVTTGLVLGVLAGLAAWLLPPDGLLAWTPTIVGTLGALLVAFGALRLFAAWQLSR